MPAFQLGATLKDPITQDLAVAALKSAPTAALATATYNPGLLLSHIAVGITILVGLAQFFTVVVNNWGAWISWWVARWSDARRIIAWVRGHG